MSLILFVLLIGAYADVLGCERALVTDTINAVKNGDSDYLTTVLNRFLLSGHRPNDLGQYRGCEHKADDSHYILLKLGNNKFQGLCVPHACSAESVKALINGKAQLLEGQMIANQFELYPDSELDTSKPPTYEMTGLSWVCACLVFCQIVVVLIASAQDVTKYENGHYTPKGQADKDSTFIRGSMPSVITTPSMEKNTMTWLQCFSLYHTVKRMHERKTVTVNGVVDPLEMFNAVRVLSIFWITYGLCVMIRYSEPIQNEEDLDDERKKGYMGFAYGSIFGIDTFFWMSGFLMAYYVLIDMIKNEGWSIEDYAFLVMKRLFRLWPCYAITLWLYFSVYPVTGLGALWEYVELTIEDCYDYWWTNIIFLNNIIPDGIGNKCFRVGWFITVDFQIFLFAPFILWIYYKFPKFSIWVISACLLVLGIALRLYLADRFDYKAVFIDPHNIEHMFWGRFYTKPYCAWAPYICGMLCGTMWVNYRCDIKSDGIGNLFTSVFRNRIGAWGALMLGTAVITALVFPLMDAYATFSNWSHDQNVAYLGLSSFIYSIAFSLVACSILFGKIPSILSVACGEMWVPFAAPIFGVYLLSYGVVTGCMIGTYKSYWWQGFNIITDFIYLICGSYVLGTAFHVLFEVPYIYLERKIFPRIPQN